MSKLLRRVLALGVVLMVVSGGTASAAPFTPELEAEYRVALADWEVTYPPQCASVSLEIVPESSLAANGGVWVEAEATMPMPGESDVKCELRLGENVATTPFACQRHEVLDHEVGHLLGYPHDSRPGSIMNPQGSTLCDAVDIAEQRKILRRRIRRCRHVRDSHPRCSYGVSLARQFLRESLAEYVPVVFP